VIDGVYAGVAGEEVDVAAPVFRRAYQAVQQQERAPGACALVVDLCSLDQDKSLFNVCKSFCHKSQPPQKEFMRRDGHTGWFRYYPAINITIMLILAKG
jgi:hypothetical protein